MTAGLFVWRQGQCGLEELDERSLSRTFGSGDEDAVCTLVLVGNGMDEFRDILESFWLLTTAHSAGRVHVG